MNLTRISVLLLNSQIVGYEIVLIGTEKYMKLMFNLRFELTSPTHDSWIDSQVMDWIPGNQTWDSKTHNLGMIFMSQFMTYELSPWVMD